MRGPLAPTAGEGEEGGGGGGGGGGAVGHGCSRFSGEGSGQGTGARDSTGLVLQRRKFWIDVWCGVVLLISRGCGRAARWGGGLRPRLHPSRALARPYSVDPARNTRTVGEKDG